MQNTNKESALTRPSEDRAKELCPLIHHTSI